MEDIAHIYKKSGSLFHIVLGKTDIQSDKNSYYKLQLLESDSSNQWVLSEICVNNYFAFFLTSDCFSYWVFRSWGRIGTTIGGNKLEDFGSSKTDALDNFYTIYEEKTGNNWSNSKEFKKVYRS